MTVTIDLSGRRALVTGAGQGIGRGIARRLAEAGAHVAVNDVVAERAAAVAAEITTDGGSAESLPFDVTDWPAVDEAVRAATFDVVVNNAGNGGRSDGGDFQDRRRFADEDPAAWGPFVDVNLHGVMHVTRAALPGMIERSHGRIITAISDSARTGEATMAVYGAAKAAAAGLTRSIAREVGANGITANCIALGSINQTERPTELEQAELGWLIKRYPVPRRGLPADVADLALFLASDFSSWLTGQTIPLNGGYSMAM